METTISRSALAIILHAAELPARPCRNASASEKFRKDKQEMNEEENRDLRAGCIGIRPAQRCSSGFSESRGGRGEKGRGEEGKMPWENGSA
jgi:hypothetical protein